MRRRALRIGASALGPIAAAVWIACGSSDGSDGDADADAGLEEAGLRERSIRDTAKKPDVEPDGPTECDPTQPFTRVAAAPGTVNTDLDDAFPTLTDDELTLYFQRAPLSGNVSPRFYRSVRMSKTDDFPAASEITELTDGRFNSAPAITGAGDVLFFSSVPLPDGNADLEMATREAGAGPFGAPIVIDALKSTDESEILPSVFGRGEELWFARGGSGSPFHLRRAVRLSGDAFTAPAPIPELEDPSGEGTSATTRDGLTVYFSASRDGGVGGVDVWVAHRQSRSAPFKSIAVVALASSLQDDSPGWLSADGCRLYFTTRRQGTSDIFVASRDP